MALSASQIGKKLCTSCECVKSITEFYPRKDAPNATHSSHCKTCRRLKNKKHNSSERKRKKNDSWRKENIDRVLLLQRLRRAKIPAEKKRASFRKWQERNRASIAARSRARQVLVKQATPWWSDKEKVLEFYYLSELKTKETGVLHHVDHIVPIKSDIVCGLHVPCNLQVLTIFANSSKKNRYWPDMP